MLSTIRSHWGIENSLHYVLDVTLKRRQEQNPKGQRSREPDHPEADSLEYAKEGADTEG